MNDILHQASAQMFKEVILRLYSDDENVRIAAIPEILKHGKIGKDLVIKIIETEQGTIIETAFDCLLNVLNEDLEKLNQERKEAEERLAKEEQEIEAESKRLAAEYNKLAAESQKLEAKREKWLEAKQTETKLELQRLLQQQKIEEKIEYLYQQDNIKVIDKVEGERVKEKIKQQIKEIYSWVEENNHEIEAEIKELIEEDNLVLDTWKRLQKIIAEKLGVDISECTLDSIPGEHLGARDEGDEIKLALAIEDEFGIEKISEMFYLRMSKLVIILIYLLHTLVKQKKGNLKSVYLL